MLMYVHIQLVLFANVFEAFGGDLEGHGSSLNNVLGR
jgi:hypothetical protein